MKLHSLIAVGCWVVVLLSIGTRRSFAEELAIDLSTDGAADQWAFLDPTAAIHNDELVLDGRDAMSRVFFQPMQWSDVTLRAKFFVEPAERGVLACGFIVGAADAATYHYVHFDRTQAILVRSDTGVCPGTRSNVPAD